MIGNLKPKIAPDERVNLIVSASAKGPGTLRLKIKPEDLPFVFNWDSKSLECSSICTVVDTLTLIPATAQCGRYTFKVVAQFFKKGVLVERESGQITVEVIPKINPEPPFTGGLSNSICWTPCEGLSEELLFFAEPVSSQFIRQGGNIINSTVHCQTIEQLTEGIRYGYLLQTTVLQNGEFLTLFSDTAYSTQDNSPPPAVQLKNFTVTPEGEVTLRWPQIQDAISPIDRYIVYRRQTPEPTFSPVDTIAFFPVRNIAPQNYFAALAEPGQSLYLDRQDKIVSIPKIIQGSAMIKTAMNDRWSEAPDFLSFHLEAPSYIFVAFDKRTIKPEWLERGFKTTRLGVITNKHPDGRLRVWQSREIFPAGEVKLGGNFAQVVEFPVGDPDMYVVFVQPVATTFPYASDDLVSFTDPLGDKHDQQTFHYRIDAIDAAGNSSSTITPPIILDLRGRCKPAVTRWFNFENERGEQFGRGVHNAICIQEPASQSECVGFRATDSLRFQAARGNINLFEIHRNSDIGVNFFDGGWIATGDLGENFCYEFNLLPAGKDANFVNDQKYFYRVQAKDVHGNLSAWSDTVSAIQDAFAPEDIKQLTARNQILPSREDGCIELTWTPVIDPVSGLQSYVIFRRDDSENAFSAIDSIPPTTTTFCDTLSKIGVNKIVHYKVAARDRVGNIRAINDIRSEVVLRALVGPLIELEASQTLECPPGVLGIKNDTLTIQWPEFDNTDVQGFAVEVSGPNAVQTVKIINGVTERFDCPLEGADGQYRIRLRAFYANSDTTIYSNAISIRKKTRLQPVQHLRAEPDHRPTGNIILSWQHPDLQEIVAFQIFNWREGESQPANPTKSLPGDSLKWVQDFVADELVAYQCNYYLVKAVDCFGLISEMDTVVSQYSNRPPTFDPTKTVINGSTITVFWERPFPRFKLDDTFKTVVMVYQDSVATEPFRMGSKFNGSDFDLIDVPSGHNYIFKVKEIILSDLGQQCSDSFMSGFSSLMVVPFDTEPEPVDFEAQPLPVLPSSNLGNVFLSWQGYASGSVDTFLIKYSMDGFQNDSKEKLVGKVDTVLVTELDISKIYDFTVQAIDTLNQRSEVDRTLRVSFDPRWQFTPKLQEFDPSCFRDSFTLKWGWFDGAAFVDSSFGADSIFVELSLDPAFEFKKTFTRLGFSRSHTFNRETHYPFVSAQNDVLYARIRAKDRWNHLSPWSTEYPQLGSLTDHYDEIPPPVVTCFIDSTKAPILGGAGKVNVFLRWDEVSDSCSGTHFYEILRNEAVIGRDSTRAAVHHFTDIGVETDENFLSTTWRVHAVDRAGNRQSAAEPARVPFIITPPDSGSCLNDTTFCWTPAQTNVSIQAITYFVEGARFPELFGALIDSANVVGGPLEERCFNFRVPWETIYWRIKARAAGFESAWSDTFFCALMPGPVVAANFRTERVPLPLEFDLKQNYPNPFNPSTTIRYAVPISVGDEVPVIIEIFNIAGQRIRTLVNEAQPPGEFSVTWDGRDDDGVQSGSGVFIYRIRAGNFVASHKMVFLK